MIRQMDMESSPREEPSDDDSLVEASVLIVDDHRLFAEAVRMSLERAGWRVQGVVGSGAQALAAARAEKPDIILLDLGLPDADGFDVGRQLFEDVPDAKIIILTGQKNSHVVAQVLKSGLFHGFATKDVQMVGLQRMIRDVVEGRITRPTPLRRVYERRPRLMDDDAAFLASQLTTREKQVLGMLAGGATSSAIAKALSISRHTVRSHVQGMLQKLQVHTRLEAVAFAVRNRIIEVNRA